MPRWLAHALIVIGWLLTPAWAWAASHVGLWLAALVALRFESPVAMLAIAGAGALLCGFAVLWTWVRFMRRLPHLLSHHMAPRGGAGIETGAKASAGATVPGRSEEHAAIAAAD